MLKKGIYRNDINGLRAIAVLSVVLFHIHEHWLPGGFVGVDIFFVISGFLISQQLFEKIGNDTFSLSDFYIKRIKRIVPVMMFVTTITLLISSFIFTPQDAVGVAESAIWSTFSAGNIYFWLFQDTGYFASSSLEIPLLHLWSLGVEEQFYMVWPLLLMLSSCFIKNNRFFIIIVALIIASFTLAQYTLTISHSFTYYMLPTRAGELLIGSLAAYLLYRNTNITCISKSALTVQCIGLLMIGWSIMFYDDRTPFPGLTAAIPTIGTALLLLAGHNKETILSRLLANKLFAFFGLISYSLYLWHWPILAFFRYAGFGVSAFAALSLFVTMIVLSYASYKLIENPLRNMSGGLLKTVSVLFLLPGALVLLISLGLIQSKGTLLSQFVTADVHNVTNISNQVLSTKSVDYICQSKLTSSPKIDDEKCVTKLSKPSKTAIIIGDSNAAHYVNVITPILNEMNVTLRNIAANSCPPVLENIENYPPTKVISVCLEYLPKLFEEALSYDVVFISASYTLYNGKDSHFFHDFEKAIKLLSSKGKKIVLMSKTPKFYGYDRRCREKEVLLTYFDCAISTQPLNDYIHEANNKVKDIAGSYQNVFYLDMSATLCPNGKCTFYDDKGHPIYFDEDHLSISGGKYIGKKLMEDKNIKEKVREFIYN